MKTRLVVWQGISLLAIVSLLGCASALATSVRLPSDDQLIIGARAIIRGKVLSVASAVVGENETGGGRIYTYTVVRVLEVLKGALAERRIVIKELGGEVGGRGSRIWGTPQFLPGEHVLLYLTTRRDGSLRVHEMFLGKFNIIEDLTSGRALVMRSPLDDNASVVVSGLGAQNHHGDGGQARSTELAGGELGDYRRRVRRLVKATRERFEQFERQAFRDVPLRPEPVEYAGLALTDTLETQFTFIRPSHPARWFEPDDGEPIVFTINPDGAPNPHILDDMTAAMNAWSNVEESALRVVNGGATTLCYPHGTGNTIVFNNCDEQFSPTPECSSIIAIGGVNWDASRTRVVGGVSFAKIYQGHITFNPYSACSFERHCDVQEIATHELGHALGLGHSRDLDATMAGTAHFDGRCASLKDDDRYGVKFIYPATANGGTFLHVTTTGMPNGYLATLFEQQLEAAGGVTLFSWSLVTTAGALPPGFVLLPSGLIRGTPTQTGSWTFTVKVTDAVGVTAQKSFTLNIRQTQPPFDAAFVSQSVPTTVQAGATFEANVKWRNIGAQGWNGSGGLRLVSQNPAHNSTWGGDTVTPLGYSVAPNQQFDLTFTARAPQTNGAYNFQWQLHQDGFGFFGQSSTNLSITVTGGVSPVAIHSPDAFAARVGAAFTEQLTAAGGVAPYSWSVAGGALPAGLTLNPTTGLLSGTPTVAGNASAVIQVTDAEQRVAQKSITIAVAAPPPPQFDITTTTLPQAIVGANYHAQLSAAGGTTPYNWSITSGALPSGIRLDGGAGTLTGTPTTAGSFPFTARAADGAARAAERALTIVVAPPPVAIVTASLPSVAARANYSAQLAATGGTTPYTWTIAAGSLPAGLSLHPASGLLSGAPTVVGSFPVTMQVIDAQGGTARKALAIEVLPAPLAIERPSAQVEGSKGAAFSYQVGVTGGAAPYSWSVAGGALPAGLTLNPATGLLSGTPSASGTFSVTIQVRDQKPDTVSTALQIHIIDPESIARITQAQYKAGKRKLQIFGERIRAGATLTIDGAPVAAKFNAGSLIVKKLILTAGSHQLVVTNNGSPPSQPFVITVQ